MRRERVSAQFPYKDPYLNDPVEISAELCEVKNLSQLNLPQRVYSLTLANGEHLANPFAGLPSFITHLHFTWEIERVRPLIKRYTNITHMYFYRDLPLDVLVLVLAKKCRSVHIEGPIPKLGPMTQVLQIINKHLQLGGDGLICQEELIQAGFSKYTEV